MFVQGLVFFFPLPPKQKTKGLISGEELILCNRKDLTPGKGKGVGESQSQN